VKELPKLQHGELFPLGRVVATPTVLRAIEKSGESPIAYLTRHHHGDWGDLTDDDKQANIEALAGGTRILSAYHLIDRTKIWIITEADRSSTCILLPSEY
jgi:D-serine deaminase-like pyridoxal phosphate-dependent protein